MSFADYYGTILEPFVKQYAEASNEKGRKGVLKNAADALRTGRDLMEDKGVDLPKDLPAVCCLRHPYLLRLTFMDSGHLPISESRDQERELG